jgi:hypothetical protein
LLAAVDCAADQQRIGFIPALREHMPVGAICADIRVQESAEPCMRDGQRADLADRLDRGGAIPVGLAGQFAHGIALAAQREHELTAVAGHEQDLRPAVNKDENVRGRLAYHAYPGPWHERDDPAKAMQGSAVGVTKQMPESFSGSSSAHVRATVGSSTLLTDLSRPGSNNESFAVD